MFNVTIERRDNSSVIILKLRLTLQVILPAQASLETPSLIDDSARPQYYKDRNTASAKFLNCLLLKT